MKRYNSAYIFIIPFRYVFWIPGDPFGVKRYMNAQQEVLDFVEVQLKEHERTFDANVIRDYIDAFISEMKKQKGIAESTFTCKLLLVLYSIA